MRRDDNHRSGTAAVLAAVFLTTAATLAAPVSHGEEGAMATVEHVEVDPGRTCTSCHEELTPEVHDAWFAGAHGMNNVRCFVCHGSTGDDFHRAPRAATCAGCHPVEAASMAGAMDAEAPMVADTGCFSCHPHHRLSPHRPSLHRLPSAPAEPAEGATEGRGDGAKPETPQPEEEER